MRSQLQLIIAQPGSLMHLQRDSMVSILLLMPNIRHSSSAKLMGHLPTESGVWAQGTGVKTAGLWRWSGKVRKEKHAELHFMSLPAFPMLCFPCMTSQEVQPPCEAWQGEPCTEGKQSIVKVGLVGVSWPETRGLGLRPGPLCEVGIMIFPVLVEQKVAFSIVSSWAEKGLTCCQHMLSLGFLNFTNLLKSVGWVRTSCDWKPCLSSLFK